MLHQEAGVKRAQAKHVWLCTTRGGSGPAMKHMYPPRCFGLRHPKSEAELAKAESRTLWALHTLKVKCCGSEALKFLQLLAVLAFVRGLKASTEFSDLCPSEHPAESSFGIVVGAWSCAAAQLL